MAGLISFLGYDGSIYLMSWTGEYVLLALLLVPYLRKFGKYTEPDFMGDRRYDWWPSLHDLLHYWSDVLRDADLVFRCLRRGHWYRWHSYQLYRDSSGVTVAPASTSRDSSTWSTICETPPMCRWRSLILAKNSATKYMMKRRNAPLLCVIAIAAACDYRKSN